MAVDFKACSVLDCNGNAHWRARGSKGYCFAHYKRFSRHGDPLAGRTPVGRPRAFVASAIVYQSDDCLIWPFSKNSAGYAQIAKAGKPHLVHRLVCEAVHGASDAHHMDAAHSCGNGHQGCVNPRHLRWATRAENLADRIEHGTSNRGERQGGSKLTEDAVVIIRGQEYLPMRVLAERYGVSPTTIHNVINRKTWAWLEP